MAAFGVISACYTNIAITVDVPARPGHPETHCAARRCPRGPTCSARVLHAMLDRRDPRRRSRSCSAGSSTTRRSRPGCRCCEFLDHARGRRRCRFAALALALTAAIPNADAAPPIVNASILPLLFLSGIFIPLGDDAPQWIIDRRQHLPGEALRRRDARRVPRQRHASSGTTIRAFPFDWTDLAVIAAWGVAGLVARGRTFSWEPRSAETLCYARAGVCGQPSSRRGSRRCGRSWSVWRRWRSLGAACARGRRPPSPEPRASRRAASIVRRAGDGCRVRGSAADLSRSRTLDDRHRQPGVPAVVRRQARPTPMEADWKFTGDPTPAKGYEARSRTRSPSDGLLRGPGRLGRASRSTSPTSRDPRTSISRSSRSPTRTKRDEAVDFSDELLRRQPGADRAEGTPIIGGDRHWRNCRISSLAAPIGTTSYDADRGHVQPTDRAGRLRRRSTDAVTALNERPGRRHRGGLPDRLLHRDPFVQQAENSTVLGQFATAEQERVLRARFAKGNPLVTCVNLAHEEMTADGTLEEIQATWLSSRRTSARSRSSRRERPPRPPMTGARPPAPSAGGAARIRRPFAPPPGVLPTRGGQGGRDRVGQHDRLRRWSSPASSRTPRYWPEVKDAFFDWDAFVECAARSRSPGSVLNVLLFLIAEVFVLICALVLAVMREPPGTGVLPASRLLDGLHRPSSAGSRRSSSSTCWGSGARARTPRRPDQSASFWGVVALMLVYSAYVAEVYRAGIESVHPSQTAAARSLGLSRWQSLRYVIVPQAVDAVDPAAA